MFIVLKFILFNKWYIYIYKHIKILKNCSKTVIISGGSILEKAERIFHAFFNNLRTVDFK